PTGCSKRLAASTALPQEVWMRIFIAVSTNGSSPPDRSSLATAASVPSKNRLSTASSYTQQAASSGLLTDVHARVIHQRRRPIRGLYRRGHPPAATEQGISYQAGLSLAAAMTFSYLAVRHMLG